MTIDAKTRDEEVPEFLPCGHNAHWQVWHSIAKGDICVFCRALKAEDRIRVLEYAVQDCLAVNEDRMFLVMVGRPEYSAAMKKIHDCIPEALRTQANHAITDLVMLAIDHGIKVGKGNQERKA